MPLNLPDSKTVDVFISAVDDHGLDGAALAPGQTCQVTSADPSVVYTSDGVTPRNAPDGTSCIESGKAAAAASITNRGAITLTSHIANADGSAGTAPDGSAIPDATDTITVVAGLARAEGILFGVPA